MNIILRQLLKHYKYSIKRQQILYTNLYVQTFSLADYTPVRDYTLFPSTSPLIPIDVSLINSKCIIRICEIGKEVQLTIGMQYN